MTVCSSHETIVDDYKGSPKDFAHRTKGGAMCRSDRRRVGYLRCDSTFDSMPVTTCVVKRFSCDPWEYSRLCARREFSLGGTTFKGPDTWL
jgi:hypothetical protein